MNHHAPSVHDTILHNSYKTQCCSGVIRFRGRHVVAGHVRASEMYSANPNWQESLKFEMEMATIGCHGRTPKGDNDHGKRHGMGSNT